MHYPDDIGWFLIAFTYAPGIWVFAVNIVYVYTYVTLTLAADADAVV